MPHQTRRVILAVMSFVPLASTSSMAANPKTIIEGELAKLDISTQDCVAQVLFENAMADLRGDESDLDQSKTRLCVAKANLQFELAKVRLSSLFKSDKAKLSDIKSWYVDYRSLLKELPFAHQQAKDIGKRLEEANSSLESALEF